jgi:hypothetical protein
MPTEAQIAYKAEMKRRGEWGKYRGDRTKQTRRYRAKYPEKVRASRLLQSAIEAGRIIKPKSCAICMRDGRIEGHHKDRKKPYDVDWLCPWCHNVVEAEGDG